jgi:hypothetical protein
LNSKTFDFPNGRVASRSAAATAPSAPHSIRLTGGPDEAWRVGRSYPAFIAVTIGTIWAGSAAPPVSRPLLAAS